MSRKRAIEICKNVRSTVSKMTPVVRGFKNEMFETPRASKEKLLRIIKRLFKKYNLKEEEVKI
tara:strand:+ start:6532 stop:6720 length:189 start_codon:yes stop_codon:yes gene_type:complete